MPEERERATTSRSVRESLSPEIRLALIEERLDNGARAFVKFETRLDGVAAAAAPKRVALWPFITFGFLVLNAGGAWLWQAAQYPGRGEFTQALDSTSQKLEALRSETQTLHEDVIKLEVQQDDRNKLPSLLREALLPLTRRPK